MPKPKYIYNTVTHVSIHENKGPGTPKTYKHERKMKKKPADDKTDIVGTPGEYKDDIVDTPEEYEDDYSDDVFEPFVPEDENTPKPEPVKPEIASAPAPEPVQAELVKDLTYFSINDLKEIVRYNQINNTCGIITRNPKIKLQTTCNDGKPIEQFTINNITLQPTISGTFEANKTVRSIDIDEILSNTSINVRIPESKSTTKSTTIILPIKYNNPDYITYNTQNTSLRSIILTSEPINLAISRDNEEYPFTVKDNIFDIPGLTAKLKEISQNIEKIKQGQIQNISGGRRPKRRTRKHAKKQRSRRRRHYTRRHRK
jgi:hypothetical protein